MPKEFTNNMSKLFYDHLVDLSDLEKLVKKHVKDEAARAEIYQLVDEIVHHKVVGCILDKLPHEYHKEFLDGIHKRPHDEKLLDFVRERVSEDVDEFVRREIYVLGTELLAMFATKDEKLQRSNLH